MIENFREIEMSQLVKADWNYKEDDKALTEKLRANIKRNGQIENIIVRKLETGFFEIVNGNHRFDAMDGIMETAICYDLGEISDAKARRIAIETNETRFATDPVKIAQVVKDILEEYDAPDLATTMPFNETQIGDYLSLLDFDFDGLGKGGEGGGEDGLEGKKVYVTVDDETYEKWFEWKQRVAELAQDDTDEEAFRILVDLGVRIDLATAFLD